MQQLESWRCFKSALITTELDTRTMSESWVLKHRLSNLRWWLAYISFLKVENISCRKSEVLVATSLQVGLFAPSKLPRGFVIIGPETTAMWFWNYCESFCWRLFMNYLKVTASNAVLLPRLHSAQKESLDQAAIGEGSLQRAWTKEANQSETFIVSDRVSDQNEYQDLRNPIRSKNEHVFSNVSNKSPTGLCLFASPQWWVCHQIKWYLSCPTLTNFKPYTI